jgi:predicted glycoside hydrolase/deacetylase ChbG (UPF0249 family)
LLAQFDAVAFSRGSCIATDSFAGLFESGALSESRLLQILEGLRSVTTELVCHPGCDDSSPKYAVWNKRRQVELASLTSELVKNAIGNREIELINYRQL